MKVLLERHENVARVILNRPEVMNALDMEIRIELAEKLRQLTDDESVRAVILTGAGKAFCSGADVTGQGKLPVPLFEKRIDAVNACVNLLSEMRKPVIAEVNGLATGVGCGLVFSCDIVFASEKAKFSQIFSRVGLVPDGRNIFFLSRMLSLPIAKELVFTGRMVRAQEALELGLINRVLPHEELQQATMEFATELANGPTKAYGLAKHLFKLALQGDIEAFAEAENYAQLQCLHSDDHQEGRAAFTEKRAPKFIGK